MKTQEQIDKIKAVVLYILQHFPNGLDYVKLFKIMYFAQRSYLTEYGICIIEDTFKARQKGPVPALTYKVMKKVEGGESFEECFDLNDFASSISVDEDQIVKAIKKPDMDYIADMEVECLDKTIGQYANVDSNDLSKLSHDGAYNKVKRRMKDDPEKDVLTAIDIARAGGAEKQTIDYIRDVQLIKSAFHAY